MGPQSFEERIQHQFDSYSKKTLKLTARESYRRIRRRGEREIVLSELSEQDLVKLAVTDEYFKDASGRIPGAVKKGDLWLIPADAEKPVDGRRKEGKNA